MSMIRPLAAALAAGLFALTATGADCDKSTRQALLTELNGAWFEGGPQDLARTAVELEAKGRKLRLWTVWLEDDREGANWVKGQRTGPFGSFSFEGPGCRQLVGTAFDGLEARGILSEDRRELRIEYRTEDGASRVLAYRRRERASGF